MAACFFDLASESATRGSLRNRRTLFLLLCGLLLRCVASHRLARYTAMGNELEPLGVVGDDPTPLDLEGLTFFPCFSCCSARNASALESAAAGGSVRSVRVHLFSPILLFLSLSLVRVNLSFKSRVCSLEKIQRLNRSPPLRPKYKKQNRSCLAFRPHSRKSEGMLLAWREKTGDSLSSDAIATFGCTDDPPPPPPYPLLNSISVRLVSEMSGPRFLAS